jgi:hypothetical protein
MYNLQNMILYLVFIIIDKEQKGTSKNCIYIYYNVQFYSLLKSYYS